ncbi:hypothetical protein [Kibdelosporangium philippinense]|uniref:hypothetical protein n=1 Tax=Kibdelosporangium philippinense TaxID=211113 RepID=UPI00361F956D
MTDPADPFAIRPEHRETGELTRENPGLWRPRDQASRPLPVTPGAARASRWAWNAYRIRSPSGVC